MTKNEERINKLFEELVPASGKAESLAGELIRAMSRIAYRFYNDGDQVGMGYGKETCNPAARFLMAKGSKRVSSLATAIWGIYDESAYEDLLELTDNMDDGDRECFTLEDAEQMVADQHTYERTHGLPEGEYDPHFWFDTIMDIIEQETAENEEEEDED